MGGPVEPGRGFVLHSPEYEGQSTINVTGPDGPRWGLTSTLDVLKDIADGKGPARWLAALGYTGWGAGQLDGEMTRHGWHAVPGDTALLFDTALEDRWPAAFGTMGINVSRLSTEAGRA
jgi:putative transcriptional regulator